MKRGGIPRCQGEPPNFSTLDPGFLQLHMISYRAKRPYNSRCAYAHTQCLRKNTCLRRRRPLGRQAFRAPSQGLESTFPPLDRTAKARSKGALFFHRPARHQLYDAPALGPQQRARQHPRGAQSAGVCAGIGALGARSHRIRVNWSTGFLDYVPVNSRRFPDIFGDFCKNKTVFL